MSAWALSPAAIEDLDAILAHVEREAGPQTAANLFERFSGAFALLAANPRIGRLAEVFTGPSVRHWTVESYIVYYESETSPLRVVRVVHAARDLENVLRGLG